RDVIQVTHVHIAFLVRRRFHRSTRIHFKFRIHSQVIAACGSAAKCDLARDKGAFATIDYSSQPLHDKVKAITEGRGVDVIMDFVGGDLFKQCLKCIAWEGRIVIVGFASGSVQQIPANAALLNSCSIMGIWWGEYMQRAPEVLQ
ncbi:PREDICTED: quinone oxidoreductase-like protein 2 homolog, partial [Priapulus caudatus]|uniref:Quinone oxidoreductase-like protein 2 homolog n=1 Tax=Priapulus caudatus TaxID=37621 RepID=A0ABM1F6G4_PRICU